MVAGAKQPRPRPAESRDRQFRKICAAARGKDMTPASLVVAGLLGAWFLLELAIQFPCARCKRLRFLDPTAHLLAAWNFFAPKPIMGDVELFYRHIRRNSEANSPSGTLKAVKWRLVQPNGDRCLYHLVINPEKR